MFQTVLIASVVLVLLILVVLYKIGALVSISKGKSEHDQTKGNTINGILMVVFMVVTMLLLLWYTVARYDLYTLPIASEHGERTDFLLMLTTVITGIVFVITQVALFWFSYRYKYNKDRKALFFADNTKLEIIWTSVPAVVLTVLVITGLNAWNDITGTAPEDAEVIEVMGQQFAWNFRYPGPDGKLGKYDYRMIDASNNHGMDLADKNSHDDFNANDLHVPKGKPVLFKIRARDVIHSVYAPHFRLKMDAVPGMPTRFWFVPTKTTQEMREELGNREFNYELACAEICGSGHFSMRKIIIVDEPADYEKWKAKQKSWLSRNPEYLAQIPEDLQEVAMISAGIENTEINEADNASL